MASHGNQLSVFLAVQTAFVMLDLFEIKRGQAGARLTELLSRHRRMILFLVVVWAIYFAIQTLLLAATPSIEQMITRLARIADLSGPSRPPESEAVTAIFILCFLTAAFLTAALLDYALHRWMLHHRRFWFLHEYHHLPTQVFNGMPGISVRPFVAPTIFLTYFGASAMLAAATSLIGQGWLFEWYLNNLPVLILLFTIIGSASHSCFLRRYWRVHRVMSLFFLTTPQEHLLHHCARLAGNYGNFVTLWDRVFGTYLDPRIVRAEGQELGLPYDQDFLGVLSAGRWKLSQTTRERCQLDRVCNLGK